MRRELLVRKSNCSNLQSSKNLFFSQTVFSTKSLLTCGTASTLCVYSTSRQRSRRSKTWWGEEKFMSRHVLCRPKLLLINFYRFFNGDCDIYLELSLQSCSQPRVAKLDKAVGTVRRQLVLDHILLNLRHKYNWNILSATKSNLLLSDKFSLHLSFEKVFKQ